MKIMDFNASTLYSDACLVFIVTGLICAVFRWFHMCRPYDKEEKYFYPARKMVAFFCAAVALLEIPYYICPMDDGVFNYSRILGVIYYPLCFAMLFRRYFRWEKVESKFEWTLFATIMSILVILMVTSIAKPSFFETYSFWILAAGGLLSVALTVILIMRLLWIYRKIDDFHHQNYSSDDDFPYRFAERTLWLPVIWIIAVWAILISGSREVKAVMDLLLSGGAVCFVVFILHPQRMLTSKGTDTVVDSIEEAEEMRMEEEVEMIIEENGIPEDADEEEYEIDEEAKRQVLDVILHRFKEQHLQKKDVLAEVDKGKMAPASRFIANVGYYNLINMFRLEYARQYSEANPKEKQSAVAAASGFSSGPSFSKAKKNVTFIDPELVSEVRL